MRVFAMSWLNYPLPESAEGCTFVPEPDGETAEKDPVLMCTFLIYDRLAEREGFKLSQALILP
jgi:hypothetical protein